MISIVTDNSSDINSELAKENQIELLNCTVEWPQKEKVSDENFYNFMRERNIIPKTSAVPTGDYKNLFERLLEKSEEILCITPSFKISACYNSAKLAKSVLSPEEQKRIFIFNSETGLGAHGLIVLKAKELSIKGMPAEKIINILKTKYLPNSLCAGFLESTKWLKAGGRIPSGVATLFEQLLKIKIYPVIGIQGNEGKIKPIGIKIKVNNFSNGLFDFILKKIKKENKKFNFFISFTDNFDEAKKLESLLKKENFTNKIYISRLNETVGSHVGPGALFLSLIPD